MNVKHNGFTLHVNPDYDPPHPRRDCDHLGTMLGWHSRYCLSDTPKYAEPDDFYESEEAKKIYVSLPVYMLDHSGISLSTEDFNDPWDSGRLGLIYCTKEQAEKWYGYLPDEETLKQHLRSEIEEYNDYLNGSWYQFHIEGLNGEIEESCGGFYQSDTFSDVLEDMKEYVGVEYHALFDKLSARLESGACM